MPDPQPRMNTNSRPRPDYGCTTCEDLLKKVNEARMHALLATAWAELRGKQPTAKVQVQNAASQLEQAFKELEGHWREAHRMNC